MVNLLHTPVPSQGTQQHQVNISASLVHRTDVANVRHDLSLLEQLQNEQEQLQILPNPALSRFNVGKWLALVLAKRTQVRIELIKSSSGQKAWRVYNPRTGQSRYAETSTEMIAWLEGQHLTR